MRRTKQTDWIFSFLQILNLHISVHKQEIFCSIILFGIIFCIAAESKSQTCNPAPIGLAEWWTADSNAFGVRNRNNGTLLNGTTFVSGINGQVFSFDGINDSVVITDSPSLDITGNQLTIEAWIKVDSTFSDYRQIVSMNNRKFGLFAQIGSGQLVFEVSTTDGYGLSRSNISIPPNRFVHVAGVYNGK